MIHAVDAGAWEASLITYLSRRVDQGQIEVTSMDMAGSHVFMSCQSCTALDLVNMCSDYYHKHS
jgi:hypothetical protein